MHILSTERLDLHVMQPADAEFQFQLTKQPGWIANIGDKGWQSAAEAEQYIREKLLLTQQEKGFSLYRVSLRESGVPIGLCGLVSRPELPSPDLGYALLAEYEGKGYAIEAARAVCQYAKQTLGMQRLLAITAPHNAASAKLLQKLGMQLQPERIEHKGEWDLLFALDL